MVDNFSDAVNRVIAHEGEYSNDPSDPGGETKWGICHNSYPELNIKNLTIEQAKEIYKRDYWDNICDWLPYKDLQILFFDTVVNLGKRGATKVLQKTVNAYLDKIVNEDGVLGKKTREAVIKVLSNKGLRQEILYCFAIERIKHYLFLVKQHRSQNKYLVGWINRVLDYT